MAHTGSCLCGAVTFSADEVERHVHACHCSMCRNYNGGPMFGISVENLSFGGEENIGRYSSSDWAERGFCTKCGSSLFYRLKELDQYILNQGAFDDQSVFTLTGEIYIDEKPDGYSFAGDHPRLTGEEFMASLQGG